MTALSRLFLADLIHVTFAPFVVGVVLRLPGWAERSLSKVVGATYALAGLLLILLLPFR